MPFFKKLFSLKAVCRYSLLLCCLLLAGCQYWYKDMKGFLEYWTGTVSLGEVTWSASPASQKNSMGVDTISTNARVTANITVVNPEDYPLDATVGAEGGLHSVRVSGAAASALLPLVHAKVLSPTSMTVELDPFSQVLTSESLALEHTSFTVEFIPTRNDNAMESTTTHSLTLQYNTPPRMPLAVIKDSSGSYRWPTNGDRWDVSQGELYFAWPQDKTKSGGGAPSHPDYVERFYIEDDGTDSNWYDEPDWREYTGATLTGNDGTVYNIYWYLSTGTTVTVYAEDGTGVRGAGITSGALQGITLEGNGGAFGSSGSVTVFRAAGSSLNGGDLDIPTRSGHYLSGWSLSPGGAPLEFPYTVSTPVTLYALWTAGTSGGGVPPVTPPPPVPPTPPVTDPHVMYVDPTSGNDTSDGLSAVTAFKTLQAAVNKVVAANDGSPYTINLMGAVDDSGSPAYSSATSNSLVSVVPGKALSLTIKSDIGGSSHTIDAGRTANRTGRVLYVGADATVTLQDVVVTGGYSTESGGGIHIAGGSVILGGSAVVRDNEALNGGGVAVSDGTLRLDGGSISGNKATDNGGGVSVSVGNLEMSGGEISGNTATGNGGGVYVASTGTVSIAGGAIGVSGSPNTAFKGGGIGVSDGIVFMTDGFVSHNNASDSGGGIYIESGIVEMQGGVISSNSVTSGNGGGVYVVSGASFEFVNGTIGGAGAGNTASSNGGGIFNAGDVTISGGMLSHNSAGTSGGGIVNNGTLSMTDGSISNNTASYNGGGVNNAGTLTMTGGTILSNSASNSGGGVYQNGTFNMGGGATVNLGNEVYLATGKTITITSELTDASVANIKLSSYGVGTQLLEADSGVDLAAAALKFMVNMDIVSGNSTHYVDVSGRLQNN